MAEDRSTFKADYAASGRSKCARCRQTIDDQEFRIGPMVQSDKGDFKYPQWHHFSCFEDGWVKKHTGELVDAAQVSGLDRLKFEDQKKIKSLIVAGDSTAERKAHTDDEKKLAAESKLVWTKAQQLENLSNAELAELLDANDQPNSGKIFGGRNNMVQRVADAMVFGAIEKCAVCKHGDLYFSHGVYKCSGNVDEFAKCEWKGTDAKRKAFVVPEDLRDNHPFLKSYKFKARDKATVAVSAVAENANPTLNNVVSVKKRGRPEEAVETPDASAAAGAAVPDAAAADDDKAATAAPAKGCFAGCLVTAVGKLSRTQKALEDLIVSCGGTFSKSLAADICVTTAQEVSGGGTKKGADAVKNGLLCVSEQWVDESIKAGHRLLGAELSPFVLANAKGEHDATRKHRTEVGSKNEAVAEAAKVRSQLEENFTNKSTAKSAVKKLVVKGSGGAVDEDSGLVEDGHILVKAGDTYNATMNQADVTSGTNSFYILQVIEHDKMQQWTCFRKWGKVGAADIGATKSTNYPTADAAIREFKKTFFDKTGNHWENRKDFKKVYGKFTLIDIDYDAQPAGGGGGAASAGDYKGALDRSTRDFVSLIFDMKVMTDALKELEIDTEKMPLGKLSKATIAKGFGALSELQKVFEADPDAVTNNRARVVSLTNQFYSYIPHSVPTGAKALPLIVSLDMVKAKTELVQALAEMEVAAKLMSSDTAEDGEHPIDAHYKKLKTQLRGVEKGSELWQRLDTYLQHTHASTHTMYSLELVDLLEMNHEGDDARFAPWAGNGNRMLLWHGSRLTNWVGIISQGLRIAPPEAPSTGYMFGKGAYFADMSSKSANYCFTSSDKTTGILMLCEVALGNMKERKAAFFETAIPNKTHQSTYGIGKNHPDPKGAFHEDSGCVIPMGKGVPSPQQDTTLLYNEFIVYDTAQVRPRYLLRLNFNYKKKCGTFF
jgi:predicted DNA-binding WGR domain protein